MNEMKDWIWIAVAGIWIVMRVLPRLFKSRDQGAKPVSEAKMPASSVPEAKTQIPKWVSGGFGQAAPGGKSVKSPPPIEPR